MNALRPFKTMKSLLSNIRLFAPCLVGLVVGVNGHALAFAQSQPKTNPEFLMNKMVGKWVMRGTIADGKVVHDVTIDRILDGRYVRIHELSREKTSSGKPEYEAWIHVSWDKANKEFALMWLDNTATANFSADGVGHGKPNGNRIPFIWKLSDGSGIHNTFTYESSTDTWTWKIDNLDKSGKASPFGRVTLKRR